MRRARSLSRKGAATVLPQARRGNSCVVVQLLQVGSPSSTRLASADAILWCSGGIVVPPRSHVVPNHHQQQQHQNQHHLAWENLQPTPPSHLLPSPLCGLLLRPSLLRVARKRHVHPLCAH